MFHRGSTRRRIGAIVAGVVAMTATTIGIAAPAAAADDVPGSRFTLAVLPDTQFYSRYTASNFEPDYGTNPYVEQAKWIAAHADELNIPFTVHLGDVVDRVGVSTEWQVADAAMAALEDAGAPYSVLAGNHDVRNSSDDHFDDEYDLTDEPFLDWFGTDRAAAVPTFGGADPTGFNRYHVFEAEGQEFLVLAVSWRASDATLAWANDVIAAHPELPVILTSHDIIGFANDGSGGFTSNNGERMWQQLIADNDQIFLTLNGHYHGAAVTQRTNNAGNPVTQVLMDYQMAYEGGNGYMGLFEFDLSNDVIHVETVSPWVVTKPTESLTTYDVPVLDGPAQRFDIGIDFSARFGGFAPGFGPGDGQWPSLSDRAVELITDGFEGAPPSQEVPAGSFDDFVPVEGTLAHWQMSGDTGVLDEGAAIEDIAGDNDLHRVTIDESGSTAAEIGDVTIADSAHEFAASGQSVCLANSSQQTDRFSYLSTDADTPVTNVDFANGYTIETFVRMDPSWTAGDNAWSKALVRTGNRSTIPGMPWTQWDYTASPAALGISNLREFQWTEIGQDATKGDKTNWSGEILIGTWNHVALVNDPATAETTMYVNGAPTLRTAQDTIGGAFNEGMPWIVGADWVDDAARNGWNGCIGETRIVDHPLGQDEWLTARPDLSGFAVTDAPQDPIDPELTEVMIEGTGVARASVEVIESDLSTTVGEDGTWTLPVPTAMVSPSGTTLTLTQGFGSRRSEPATVTLRLAGTADGDVAIEVIVPDVVEPGEFVWSIDGNPNVAMSEAANMGSYLQSTGGLTPIVVTDTRDGGPEWSLSGQVSDFTDGLPGSYLGWTPEVLTPGAGATAGDPVTSGFDTGNGLADPSTLASADAGHDPGNGTVGADLDLRLPVDTPTGTYTATLTITALS